MLNASQRSLCELILPEIRLEMPQRPGQVYVCTLRIVMAKTLSGRCENGLRHEGVTRRH